MVKLRLARVGRKKVPFYHLVATDSRNPRDTSFIEKLGYFNPLADGPAATKFDVAKINEWLNKGAQPSDRLQKLFLANKEIGTEKQRKGWQTEAGIRVKAIQGRIAAEKAKAEKAAAAEAAANAPAPEAAPAAAPAEQPSA